MALGQGLSSATSHLVDGLGTGDDIQHFSGGGLLPRRVFIAA